MQRPAGARVAGAGGEGWARGKGRQDSAAGVPGRARTATGAWERATARAGAGGPDAAGRRQAAARAGLRAAVRVPLRLVGGQPPAPRVISRACAPPPSPRRPASPPPRPAAGVLALAALASLALLALRDSAGRAALLQFVPRASLADGEVVYQPRRARISILPRAFLYEFPEYPPSYNNHKLREAACFGFDRNPGPPDYDNWYRVCPAGKGRAAVLRCAATCCDVLPARRRARRRRVPSP